MKRSPSLDDVLHHCLERLRAGEDVATCLRDHPEHRDVLAPLLEAAAAVRHVPLPTLPTHVRTAAHARAREAFAQRASTYTRSPSQRTWTSLRSHMMRAVLVLVLLVGTFGGVGVAAQQSLPGDALYGIKRGSEHIRQQLTPGLVGRALLYVGLADRRFTEPLALLAQARIPTRPTLAEISPAYTRAKDAIAQTQPADQVVLGEHYNRLVERHAQAIVVALQTNSSPNIRDVLNTLQGANVSAGRLVVPSIGSHDAQPTAQPAMPASASGTSSVGASPTPTVTHRTPAGGTPTGIDDPSPPTGSMTPTQVVEMRTAVVSPTQAAAQPGAVPPTEAPTPDPSPVPETATSRAEPSPLRIPSPRVEETVTIAATLLPPDAPATTAGATHIPRVPSTPTPTLSADAPSTLTPTSPPGGRRTDTAVPPDEPPVFIPAPTVPQQLLATLTVTAAPQPPKPVPTPTLTREPDPETAPRETAAPDASRVATTRADAQRE